MTAAQLVRMAGGFKRDAWLQDADLMSYRIVDGSAIISQRTDVQIGDAVLKNDRTADAPLEAWRRADRASDYGLERYRRINHHRRRGSSLRQLWIPGR